MKITSQKVFVFYIFIVFFILIGVIINHIKSFQTKKINLSQKSDLVKLIDNITKKHLSFKEASFYEVIDEK